MRFRLRLGKGTWHSMENYVRFQIQNPVVETSHRNQTIGTKRRITQNLSAKSYVKGVTLYITAPKVSLLGGVSNCYTWSHDSISFSERRAALIDFQTDALTLPPDWPDFHVFRFDRLRAPSCEHQLENLPWSLTEYTKT